MSLKIAGGLYKGLRLETPSSHTTRPTQEILRMAVFNKCQHKIEQASFLDLYAGSGAMGLEAFSRGAKSTTFVEKDRNALVALKKNIAKFPQEAALHLMPYDVKIALKKLQGQIFDLVYIDPPYGDKKLETHFEKELEDLLFYLDSSLLLAPRAWVFVEFSSYCKKDFTTLPLTHLKGESKKSFGRSLLFVFKSI
ncbi:MAG: 16S rRNA (guanine(966)-N(2))-methyltransferase RsmD [Chlamydiae bacterium]|nr:16S rRNA (guanine(966)-N(2))-methyltransferase RsmD [Chlamydiota bacterium]